MLTIAEFARKIEWAAVRAKNELEIPTEALMATLETEAKGYIGDYQEGWPRLAESTVAEKTRLGYAPPDNPLLRTGDLRGSIEHLSSPTGDGAMGEIGSNDPVALWQEYGTSRGIPPRPFIGLAMFRSQEPAIVVFGEFAVSLLA